jgi:hypothetical protein
VRFVRIDRDGHWRSPRMGRENLEHVIMDTILHISFVLLTIILFLIVGSPLFMLLWQLYVKPQIVNRGRLMEVDGLGYVKWADEPMEVR